MLFPFSVSVSALSIGSKIIVGKIITNEQLDISNIKIDIYNSILVNEADGVKEYNNIYYTTTYTDEYGEYSFARPSGSYLINVDLDSIPIESGINNNSIFVESHEEISNIQLSTIDAIQIDENEFENIVLLDKSGNKLVSNISIKSDLSIDANHKSITSINSIDNKITIDANGIIKQYVYTNDISNCTQFEKIELLESLDIIEMLKPPAMLGRIE